MYNEEDFLQLSGIQHFVFCRRQWALAYIEMQWEENVRTFEGRQLHKKAHDVSLKEKRGDVIIERAMPIHSRELGISGECDVVEFYESPNGVKLSGHTGKYIAIPIEYKHGRPKTNEADILQLTAQAICIEEMLCCDIPYGYIYYGETRHRQKVEITVELRQKVKMIFEEIREVICEQLEVEPEKVTLETTFEELGADSLDLFQVVIEIEDKYGIQLENAERIKTVKDAVDYVTEVTNK